MPYAVGCKDCGSPADASRCESCAQRRREQAAAERAARRNTGRCQFGGCTRQGAKHPGGRRSLCKEHLEYYAARQRDG